MVSDNSERSTCKHCDAQVDEGEDVCIDCYVFACNINAGFPA